MIVAAFVQVIDWILRQCADAAVVAGICRGQVPPWCRIESVRYHPDGHVDLDWSAR